MKRTFKLLAFILIVSFRQTTLAQLSEPGHPASMIHNTGFSDIPVIFLPDFNNEELIAQDTCQSCGDAFGIDAVKEFDFWEHASKQVINNEYDNVEIYRVKVKSNTANALHVIFSHFELATGEKIYIYSPNDTNRILGAFSAFNNKPDSTFISNRIMDSELVIEVNRKVSSHGSPKGILNIQKFIHVYEERDDFENSFNCHNNVICAPWYNDFCNEIRSVVKFYRRKVDDERWWMCSGAVVNNSNNDFDPLILTADHCVEDGRDFATWIVFFNFQSNVCDPSNNGNDLMIVTGTDVIASDHGIGCPDIALMRLRQDIPIQYNVFFSGWSSLNLTYPQDGICIHHPRGDVKKISFGEITNPLFKTCHKVTWTDGTTEGGSSGAPLYTNSRLITAVNSHAPRDKSCDDLKHNFFSRIEKSFSTLQPHLTPDEEDIVAVGGIDPLSSCQDIININGRCYPGNDWQIRNQITIQAANQVNVANFGETVIEDSPFANHGNNSDYIIKAGNRITINPGFRINRPFRANGSPNYASFFLEGNQNRVSFQIATCVPFTDDCGFNHENAFVIPKVGGIRGSDRYLENDLLVEFSLKIYPNPTNGTHNVTIEYSKEIAKVSILNNIGQTIFEEVLNADANSSKLDINDLDAGIYFVLVLDRDSKMQFKKLIVN